MCGKAQRVARLAQTRLQNSRVTGPKLLDPKFTKRLSDKEGSLGLIGGVNARIHVAIFPSIVECQRTE